MKAEYLIKFFVSLKTTVWLLCGLIALLLAGAFIMPGSPEFQTIHSMPMIEWLQEQAPGLTWWLWGTIGLLVLLTLNTLFCSIESIIKKRNLTQWLLIISPQIIHAGFLFILLGHLFSSTGGYKEFSAATEGSRIDLKNNTAVGIKAINISMDSFGYINDWVVDVEYLPDKKTDRLMPNKPSIRDGVGIYVKDLRVFPEKAVLIEISREPGAIWALAGGILFMAGTIMLVILRMKRER